MFNPEIKKNLSLMTNEELIEEKNDLVQSIQLVEENVCKRICSDEDMLAYQHFLRRLIEILKEIEQRVKIRR